LLSIGRPLVVVAAIATIAVGAARVAAAQELNPGAYTVSPVGANFFGATYQYSSGDVTFDPSIPIEDAHSRLNTIALSYGRALDVAGRSGTFLIVVPLVGGRQHGIVQGQFAEALRRGIADVQVRIAVNLYGAPAMTLSELARSSRRTTLGASLTMMIPVGQYDPAKLINLGSNRWAFKPEVGFTHNTGGRWLFEVYSGVWLFTDNTDFFGGSVRSQKPIGSAQFHVRYTFKSGLWLSANSNFYSGGRTTVDGKINLDFQRNSRVGATFNVPLTRFDALRFAVSRGAYTTIGADYTSVSAGFTHAWGGK
jgi:hypothetical protein